MDILLRFADRNDAGLIADISRQTFYDTFAADNTKEDMDKFLAEQFTKGKLMLEVGASNNAFILAYVNGQVAGYAKLRTGKEPSELKHLSAMEIARLYVLKDFIGKHVGAALMKASLRYAIEQQKQWAWLGVWERNQRAIDFYHRWGFVKFGECDFLLGDDVQRDWLMRKTLADDLLEQL